jgi:hypothetical protein
MKNLPVSWYEVRPFRVGDRASLWFGRIHVTGVIEKIYEDPPGKELYARVRIGTLSHRVYPLWQLVPAGLSRFTFHHGLFALVRLWRQLTGGTEPRNHCAPTRPPGTLEE